MLESRPNHQGNHGDQETTSHNSKQISANANKPQGTRRLFEEFATWNYERPPARNTTGKHRLQSLEACSSKEPSSQESRRLNALSLNYLAVPENTISPIELIDGWGLFYVNIETEEARLIKPPTEYGTTLELKRRPGDKHALSQAQNRSMTQSDIRLMKDQSAILVKPPTFHKK